MTQTTIVPPAYVTESEEMYDKPIDPTVARRLFAFVTPYKWQMVFSAFLMMAVTGSSVVGPYLVKVAIDDGLTAENPVALRNAVLLYLVLGDRALGIHLHARQHHGAGRAVGHLRSAQGIVRAFAETLAQFLLALFGGTGHHARDQRCGEPASVHHLGCAGHRAGPVRAGGHHHRHAGLECETLAADLYHPPAHAGGDHALYRRTARVAYRRVRAAISWVNSVLAENINGIRVVQAFQQAGAQLRQLPRYTNAYHLQTYIRAAKVAASFLPIVDVLGALATAAVIYLGGTAVLGESITAGVLVAFVLYIDALLRPHP